MTLTIHGLLHVADTIERIGPVWAWWSFPIERQCGRLQRHITDKHHPFANLDNYITLAAQFKNAKLIYNIPDEYLSLDELAKEKKGLHLNDKCMCFPSTELVKLIVLFRRRDCSTRKGQQGSPKGWRLFQRCPILPGHPIQPDTQEGSEPILGTPPCKL